MKFLDILIAWGDWYYSQYTAEKVSQAEQLYILADMILGPAAADAAPPDASRPHGACHLRVARRTSTCSPTCW